MKGKNFRQAQEEYKESVVGLCCVCQKPCKGWYGTWQEGETCTGACEKVKASQPRYPGYTEEEYLMRLAEGMDNDH